MHYTQMQKDAAENLLKPGAVIKHALMDAGYTEASASRGVESIPNRVIRLMAKKGKRFVELGGIDADTQEKLVRGRLVYNTIRGDDRGAMSAKVLGSDKRVSMFLPENQIGIQIINAPKEMSAAIIKEEE